MPTVGALLPPAACSSRADAVLTLGAAGAAGLQRCPLCWPSPRAPPPSMNGALAFVDTSDCTVMNIAEHYMASDVEWDPTGRYVVTSVSWWSHKVRPSRLAAVSPWSP